MTDQQRKILIGAGMAVAVVAVAVLAVLLTGGGDDDDVATGGSSSTVSSTTSSTQALEPVTSSTTSSTTTTPTTAPTTATTAPPQAQAPALSAQGAVLRQPRVGPPRTFDDAEGCQSLADRGPWEVECETVTAGDQQLAWMVARHPGTGAIRSYVFRRLVGNQWTVALAAADEEGVDLADVRVRVEDVSGDGRPDLVFGFRHQGTGQILEVDVVEAPGSVTLHRELDKGTAQVRPGELQDWAAQFGPDDANCCPSSFLHTVIRFQAGAWRAVGQQQVDPNSQPAGDL